MIQTNFAGIIVQIIDQNSNIRSTVQVIDQNSNIRSTVQVIDQILQEYQFNSSIKNQNGNNGSSQQP